MNTKINLFYVDHLFLIAGFAFLIFLKNLGFYIMKSLKHLSKIDIIVSIVAAIVIYFLIRIIL